jgi:spore maturation protein CgeB
MRMVVLGAGGAHKTEASIARAARALGHHCRVVNVVGWLRYAGSWGGRTVRYLAESYQPDLLLLTRHAIELGEPALRDLVRGRTTAFWYFDFDPKEKVLALGRLVGTMYVTCLGQVETYRRAGVDIVRFLPQGVDPEWDRPVPDAPRSYRCDTSFVGSGHSSYRYQVLRTVAAAVQLQIRGPGWSNAPDDLPVVGGPVQGRRLSQVIRGAAVSLGVNADPAQDHEPCSVSNRMWRVMGCAGFYLGRRVPGIENFAVGGQHCAWYSSARDAAEMARHYLTHTEERQRIAQDGHRHALAHHTYAHRLAVLLAGRDYPVQTIL